jgi:three-Cys-motif partner protein
MSSGQMDEVHPHTFVKVQILERYLNVWTAKLSQSGTTRDLVYFDPFAGIGRIKAKDRPDSEADGSAIAALRLFHNHPALKNNPVTIHAFLNEKDKGRHDVLESRVREVKTSVEHALPEDRLKVTIFNLEYPNVINNMLHHLQSTPQCVFSFIDPFGYKDNTFEAVKRLLSPEKGEVLVLFCTFRIAEVKESSGRAYKEHVANVFGLPHWTPQLRADVNGYKLQLQRRAGAKYTLHFSMRDHRDQRIYELVYATKSFTGLKVMKSVMYRMSQELDHEMMDFEFHFSDFKAQRPEGGGTQNTMSNRAHQACAERLRDHFQGKEATLSEIETFILLETAYPFFIGTLKAAAASRLILSVNKVGGGPRPKWNTFESCKIRFADESRLADDLTRMLENATDKARRLKKVEDFLEYAKFTWLGVAYTSERIWIEVESAIEDLRSRGKIHYNAERFSKQVKPYKVAIHWADGNRDV